MLAANSNKNPEVITALLEAGIDINVRDKNGRTALMWAARNNSNPSVVLTLLEAGADARLINTKGNRAIDIAATNEALKGTEAYWRLNDLSC
jgi:ankyrin repeat protein